jgi:hypothetical protein
VVGAGGRILLPGPAGMEQRIRLESEGVTFRGQRVYMEEHSWDWGRGDKERQKAKVKRQKAKVRK